MQIHIGENELFFFKKSQFITAATKITILSIMSAWIINAVISAITFAIGDFLVVRTQLENKGIIPLFLAYTLIMGVLVSISLYVYPDYYQAIRQYGTNHWKMILAISVIFLVAYYTHFRALTLAPNPGYANALVMFHVALLSLLSYYFLDKPLNRQTVLGIILMFIGAYLVVTYSDG